MTRTRSAFLLVSLTAAISGCGETKQPAEIRKESPAARPQPTDESRRFPKAGLVETRVTQVVYGKEFLPGGTVAVYRLPKREWTTFVIKTASPSDAAIALLDWKKALSDSKLVPSFGGYFGTEGGKPVFVFTKGRWVAGVVGLPEKEADAQARLLAARLD